MEPKLVYGGSWLSNKLCNTRVSVLVGHLDDTFTNKTKHRSNERKPVCDLTYHISPSQIIHEKLHPGINETNLCLRIAVNGASKSLRGELPLSNLNLNQGDFGDDAGMIVENRHFCFIGKLELNRVERQKKNIYYFNFSKVLLMVQVVIVRLE